MIPKKCSQTRPPGNHKRNSTAKDPYSRIQGSTEAIVNVREGDCDVHKRRSGRQNAIDVNRNNAAEDRLIVLPFYVTRVS